jgi:hypothetical protein
MKVSRRRNMGSGSQYNCGVCGVEFQNGDHLDRHVPCPDGASIARAVDKRTSIKFSELAKLRGVQKAYLESQTWMKEVADLLDAMLDAKTAEESHDVLVNHTNEFEDAIRRLRE